MHPASKRKATPGSKEWSKRLRRNRRAAAAEIEAAARVARSMERTDQRVHLVENGKVVCQSDGRWTELFQSVTCAICLAVVVNR